MAVTKNNKELISEITATSRYWANAILFYQKNHKITQNQIAMRLRCKQGTVSKKLKIENFGDLSKTYWYLSLEDANRICKAMDTTLGKVTNEYDQHLDQNSSQNSPKEYKEYSEQMHSSDIPSPCTNIPENSHMIFPSCLITEGATLVNQKSDPMFAQWFGTYHCYFFSTLSHEDKCFHGILEIPKHPSEGCCNVSFSFDFSEGKQTKDYYGQLILSRKNGGAYCILANQNDLGEISFLLMANPVMNNGGICCAVALVATISGGKDTRRPCTERMLISRVELDGERFKLLKAHLLLNDKNIRITEESFLEMLQDDATPKKFRELFQSDHPFDNNPLCTYLTKTAIIPESWVKSLTVCFSEDEMQTIIDLLRLYSLAPKYNKVKQKTAEHDIFNLFKEEFKPWSVSID